MRKRILAIVVMVCPYFFLNAQDIWYTRNGTISFHAGTSLEDIDAVNNDVGSYINIKSGEVAFTVLVKSFHFRRALMEQHFNESYMESTKFPKATFSGKITEDAKVNFGRDGNYPVSIEGDLTIHGVIRKVTVPANILVKGGIFTATSNFKVIISDYGISIPGIVVNKISKVASIEAKCHYEKKN